MFFVLPRGKKKHSVFGTAFPHERTAMQLKELP